MSPALHEERVQSGAGQNNSAETSIGPPDTFPKLLRHHAQRRGGRPAVRHKDRGIWRSWSWAEVEREVRAYALGLSRLGLKRGDSFYFESATPHRWTNPGPTETWLLWVNTPPTF